MKITTLLLLGTLLAVLAVASTPPAPYCKSRPLYSHLPLTINETLLGDLEYAFTGYNLNFRVIQGGDFARVDHKMDMLNYKNYDFSELINFRVTHNGNKWGNEMYVLSDDRGQTVLHFGTFNNHSQSPQLEAAVVEYQQNSTCFDAALFMDQGIAVVDCIELVKGEWQNKFIHINLATRERIRVVPNEMYSNFTSSTKRKIMRYHDPHNGLEYMIRAYFSNDNNSYIQFFQASDLSEMQVLRIIDRVELGLNKLNIADIKVYMGDVFVLDFYSGLYRLDILRGQLIAITGHYSGEKYTHFSIYSDDLDEQLIFALSNNHAVYEISWDRGSEPYLVTKYTLPSNSSVHSLMIDEKFVIVQASANMTTKNESLMSNYTYIFTKGSRTYLNAYKVIEHHSTNVLLDFDRVEKRLIIVAETNVTNYKLNDATLYIFQNSSEALSKNYTLKIEATSTDPHSTKIEVCVSQTLVSFVSENDKTIYPTNISLPKTYFSSYLGEVTVNLRNYAIGPNITYNVTENGSLEDPPVFWINQQNKTVLSFNGTPIIGNTEFLYAEVFPHEGNNTIFYFFQEPSNDFHVTKCIHLSNDDKIQCTELWTHSYRYKINSFSSAVFMKDGQLHMYHAVTIEGANVVFIHHNSERVAQISFPEGYEGKIGDVESSNGYLYILFPYMKTIKVYKLSKCDNFTCPLEFEINSHTLANLNVKYFNPLDIVVSRFHPEVLFINCLGTLVIIDIDNHENMILLSEISTSRAVATEGYQVAVHDDELLLIAAPDIIEEYSIKNIYALRTVTYMKKLNLYQYKMDVDFDVEYSDHNRLFYVTAIDGNTNHTTILIYKTGSPLVNSLYDVINLNATYNHKNLFIEVCGFHLDYVNILTQNSFQVIREYPEPILVVENTFEDFKINVQYYNTETNKSLATLNFSIAKFPQGFNATQEFKQNIKNNLKATSKGHYTWNTRNWFEGHVIGYNYTSDDSHVRLISNIQDRRVLPVKGKDFVDTMIGGVALADDLLRLHHNGSVEKIFLIGNQAKEERCLRIASRADDVLTITGCEHYGGGVSVYITAETDYRGFTWGPYLTEAYSIRNIQMVNYIVMIADTDEPYYMHRAGSVFLYALNMDPDTGEEMDLIETIDSNDFMGSHGWDNEDAFLGNSHLVYDKQDNAYRLYVTEMYKGLFVMEFKHNFGDNEIQVLTTNFVDLHRILQQNGFHMPVDAHFLAVTFSSGRDNPVYEMETIIVTTNNYHNFEFTIIYDLNAQIIATHLHRVYYRYGFYQGANLVKCEDGYMAVPYTIPSFMAHIPKYSRQLVVVYDTRDYDNEHHEGFGKRYILGGFRINSTKPPGFGFNVTQDVTHNGTRTGLVVVDIQNSRMHETSLSRNITVEVDEGYHSGKMTVTAYSDFHTEEFDLEYIAPTHDTRLQVWEIVLIVVSSVVFALLMGYLFYLCWKKSQSKPVNEIRQSLMESETGDALLRDGTGQSVRGSVPVVARESHFRKTMDFETQTDIIAASEILIQEVVRREVILAGTSEDPVVVREERVIVREEVTESQKEKVNNQSDETNAPSQAKKTLVEPKVEAPPVALILEAPIQPRVEAPQQSQASQQLGVPPTEEIFREESKAE